MLQKNVGFKRVWNTLAETKTPAQVVFGSWLAHGHSREADARDFRFAETMLNPQSDSVILDVGCGPLARALVYFGQKGYRVVGVDVSVAGVARAKHVLNRLEIRGNVELVVGDAEFLPFRKGSFDRALAVSVISHLASKNSIVTALRELRQCVKENGRCYLSWWLNLYSPLSVILVLFTRVAYLGATDRIQILTFKGVKEVRQLCGQARLRIERVVAGSSFWYVFYLLPKVFHRWNETLLQRLQTSRRRFARVFLPPLCFDLVACRASSRE